MTTTTETQDTDPYGQLIGIKDDALTEALAQLDGTLGYQVERIIGLIRELRVEANHSQRNYEAAMKEAAKDAENGKACLNRATALEAYLLQQLIGHDVHRLDTGNGNAIVLESPPTCTVVDADLVPAEYRRLIPETYRVDSRGLIKQWLKIDDPLIFAEAVRGVEIKRGPAYLKIT